MIASRGDREEAELGSDSSPSCFGAARNRARAAAGRFEVVTWRDSYGGEIDDFKHAK